MRVVPYSTKERQGKAINPDVESIHYAAFEGPSTEERRGPAYPITGPHRCSLYAKKTFVLYLAHSILRGLFLVRIRRDSPREQRPAALGAHVQANVKRHSV